MASESMRRLVEALEGWNSRDYETVMANIAEDVVWKTGGQIPDIEDVYEGHEGVMQFFREFIDPWEKISIEIVDVLEDREDQIFLVVRFRATGRGGIEVDARFFQVYRYDDQHQLTWFQAFPEEAEAEARRVAAEATG